MPDFRRGPAAIQEAVDSARSGGGEYKPFMPSIFWKDGDTKYVLVLNPIDDILRVLLHAFLPLTDGRFDQVIARTDEAFGERLDPIEQEWKYTPRLTNVMVAVELEPIVTVVNGYERPRGFEVKTKTFERRIRDEDGDLTEQREEVTVPCVGVITQSPINFGNLLADFAAKDGPIHTTALRISRLGQKDPTYKVDGYLSEEIDLSNLFDYIEDINYIDDMDDFLEAIRSCETDEDATVLVGTTILDKRLEELADNDHYDQVLSMIAKESQYQDTKGKKGAAKPKPKRAVRPSQRREPEETTGNMDAPDEDTPAEAPEPKPRIRARTRTASEEVTKESPVPEKLSRLRQRTAEIQQGKPAETDPAAA